MVFLLLVGLLLALLVGNSLTVLASSLESSSDQFQQRQAEYPIQSESLNQVVNNTQLRAAISPSTLVGVLGTAAQIVTDLVKNAFLILMVTIFVLVEGPMFLKRMVQALGKDHFLAPKITALAHMMISYFGLRAIVNLVVAVATGIMLWLFGVAYAGLWAVLLFFLSFIPYIGAILAMTPPVILAWAESGLWTAIVVGVLALVINSITENIISPMIMGKGLSISPTIVFLSSMFWIFILGGTGAFVAMPLTMTLIMVMSLFEETHNIAAMMVTIHQPASVETAQSA